MMKTTKIYFILLFSALICLCTSNLKSQTTSVINTIDLDILPPHGTNVNLAADSNTYTLTVKIDDINSTSNVYFLLGERKDAATILNIDASVIKEQNQYFIQSGTKKYLFTNYTILLPITLTKDQFKSLKYITFYLKDKKGKLTPRLYFNIPQ